MAITLDQARAILSGAFAARQAAGMNPLAVVVLDAGGHVKAFEREDGASNERFGVANGKAHGAIAMGMNSRALEELANLRPNFVNGLVGSIGPLIPGAGGVVIVDAEGGPIGAVGISGDTSDNDEIAALAGISAAGLTAKE